MKRRDKLRRCVDKQKKRKGYKQATDGRNQNEEEEKKKKKKKKENKTKK